MYLRRQFKIIDRAGRRREMPDVIHRLVQKQEFRDVLLDEFVVLTAGQVIDVLHRAGHEIVDANDAVAA